MLDLAKKHCVIRDCSQYVFRAGEKICRTHAHEEPKFSCADSQIFSAYREVTFVQGSVLAVTVHKAECRLCKHECDGDQPAHEQSYRYPIRCMNQCCLDASLALLYDSPVLPRVACARQKGRLCIERGMYPLFTALLSVLLTQVKFMRTCQASIGEQYAAFNNTTHSGVLSCFKLWPLRAINRSFV